MPAIVGIVDTHIHCELEAGIHYPGQSQATERSLREALDRAAVVSAITDSTFPNLNAVALLSTRIIRLAVVGRSGWDVQAIESGLRSGLFRGIKINVGFLDASPISADFADLYRLASEFDVPVVFHTGDPDWAGAKAQFCRPLLVDDVAVKYPSVNFLLYHCGNPWFQDAAVVTSKNPNVFLDTSAIICGPVDVKSDRTRVLLLEPLRWLTHYLDDPTKLLFGSGWPMVDLPTYANAIRAAVPESWHDAVFHSNAARLFKLGSD